MMHPEPLDRFCSAWLACRQGNLDHLLVRLGLSRSAMAVVEYHEIFRRSATRTSSTTGLLG
jgi:hypothetical protein